MAASSACASTWSSNLGAYLAPTGPFINTIGIVNCLSGVYDVPATYARIRLALTNTAPMAAYRGAGRPIMSYALERLMDHAARELGMDPAEFRRRNFIPNDKFPVQDRRRLRVRLRRLRRGDGQGAQAAATGTIF